MFNVFFDVASVFTKDSTFLRNVPLCVTLNGVDVLFEFKEVEEFAAVDVLFEFEEEAACVDEADVLAGVVDVPTPISPSVVLPPIRTVFFLFEFESLRTRSFLFIF